jgi:hypothetical protein
VPSGVVGKSLVSVSEPYRGKTDIVPGSVIEAYKRGATPMYSSSVA